jgi:hypothetical protein
MALRDLVKAFAYELGADLVGIGSIERCTHMATFPERRGRLSADAILVRRGSRLRVLAAEGGGGPATVA